MKPTERALTAPGLYEALAAVATLAIAGSALSLGAKVAFGMATSSLWTDEIWTVGRYSSLGPLHVVTTYSEANNHVFFNLLVSLLPVRGSFEPLAARAVSFVAVGLLLAGVTWFFLRRGSPVLAVVALFLFAANVEFLDLALQARGYGLAAVLVLAASAAAVEFLEKGSKRALLLAATCSVLAAWSVPTAGILCGALLLALFGARPGKPALAAGLGALLAVLVVHAPILRSMARVMTGYGSEYGRAFKGFWAVAESVKVFALRSLPWYGDPLVVILVLLLPAALLLARGAWRRRTEGARTLLLATVVFFGICLALGTPLIRATSPAAVPLVVGTLLAVEAAATFLPATPWFRGAAVLGAALLLVPTALEERRRFVFVPIESWRESARVIVRFLPSSMPVFYDANAGFARQYLPPEVELTAGFEPLAFAAGRLAAVDSPVEEPRERVKADALVSTVAEIRFPQRRANFQALYAAPPCDCGIFRISTHGSAGWRDLLCDRHQDTFVRLMGSAITVEPERALFARSLVLIFAEGHRQPPLDARLVLPSGEIEVPESLHWDRTTILRLGDRAGVRIVLFPRLDSASARLAEAWVWPTGR